MGKSVFTSKDIEAFSYALGMNDLTVKEMHIIMYLLGFKKNRYKAYFVNDKDHAYRMLLDNVDGSKDIVKNALCKIREENEKEENDSDREVDLSDMQQASDYYLERDIY